MNTPLYILLFLVGLASCDGSQVEGDHLVTQALDEGAKGYFISKRKGKLDYSATFLQPTYLASKELTSFPNSDYNLVLREYQSGYHFNFTVKPAKDVKGDLVYTGVANLEDYKTRIHDLHFNSSELFRLRGGGESLLPSLCQFNDTYEIEQGVTFTLVFERDTTVDSHDLQLVFEDLIWGTGITNFYFEKSLLTQPTD